MALPGLVAANNLADVTNKEKVWDNLGNGINYTVSGITTSGVVIRGQDILALENVRHTSTRDFVFIKGLTNTVQPRLEAVISIAVSGMELRDNTLLKTAATSSGNYFFSPGLTLSVLIARINGTNALSIATSPFSGSVATTSLFLRNLRPGLNWRISEPMSSGTIAVPDLAVPFETNDFVLFMKAGQS